MHNKELINQFVELRAQGLSVPKISEKIGVPASTLYEWDDRNRPRFNRVRLLMLEEAEDRVLGGHTAQFETLAACLRAIDKQLASQIAGGAIKTFTLPQLIRMAGSLRRQLQRLKQGASLALPEAHVQPQPSDPGHGQKP